MKRNLRSDAAGFPPGEPPRRPSTIPTFPDDGPNRDGPEREDPIIRTLLWHLNHRGVFSDPSKVDWTRDCNNLRDLLGPGADTILDELKRKLKNEYHVRVD